MKYIGIGMMWLGYAGAVAAVAFSPHSHPFLIGVVAVVGVIFVSLASGDVSN